MELQIKFNMFLYLFLFTYKFRVAYFAAFEHARKHIFKKKMIQRACKCEGDGEVLFDIECVCLHNAAAPGPKNTHTVNLVQNILM